VTIIQVQRHRDVFPMVAEQSRVSWAADVGSSIRRGRLRDASETASG
jgi:hypothetical protein